MITATNFYYVEKIIYTHYRDRIARGMGSAKMVFEGSSPHSEKVIGNREVNIACCIR